MLYYTDVINLYDIVTDPVYSTETKVDKGNIKCRVEADNKLITNSQGDDIRTNTFLVMDIDTDINVGDRFNIISKNGRAYREFTKEFQVKVIEVNAGFTIGNLEVFC